MYILQAFIPSWKDKGIHVRKNESFEMNIVTMITEIKDTGKGRNAGI